MAFHNDPFASEDVLLSFDAPAFVRRAMNVEAAWEALLAVCRRERERLLEMPRMRLARFVALADIGGPGASEVCPPAELACLIDLHREWKPLLRTIVKPARAAATLALALNELIRSFQRFNRRWGAFLRELDLQPINQLREGYNRYYLLEKECALRSARLAREGFVPLPPVRAEDLSRRFPLLKIPAGGGAGIGRETSGDGG
jgi:hypothetical protein